MNKKNYFTVFVGIAALAFTLGLNLRHAINNYGILDSRLALNVLAQSSSSDDEEDDDCECTCTDCECFFKKKKKKCKQVQTDVNISGTCTLSTPCAGCYYYSSGKNWTCDKGQETGVCKSGFAGEVQDCISCFNVKRYTLDGLTTECNN